MVKKPRRKLGPAATFNHDTHLVTNVNAKFEAGLSTGQRVADAVARVVGGWPFIITQTVIILAWMAVNGYLAYQAATNPAYFKAWDPYPFILLNLALSFQAAYTGPIVMMSQNRQAEKDRLMAEQDYHVNVRAEEEIKVLMEQLTHQDQLLLELAARLDKLGQASGLTDTEE
ncbi:MAG: hypothetical protein AUJ49_11155 [Desulfovibrionaceae bacterium CG1_02_65_16]|nr:MAG: hypothetical protein AUJ49_11155 [Desulfovibrionaceae bacterium CG1_02_65_16]